MNLSDIYKAPLNQSDVIKQSDPGAEDGSYRPGEELQQGQTSQSYKGRGQEGPSSQRRDVQGSDEHQEGREHREAALRQLQAGAREGHDSDSAASRDGKVQGGFSEHGEGGTPSKHPLQRLGTNSSLSLSPRSV